MSSFLNIEFPTLQTPLIRVYEFFHSHAKYEHEMITAHFADWDVPHESLTSGTPVSVKIMGVGTSRTINGYIHHVIPKIAANKNAVEVVIIGASYHLKQASQKVWHNMTAHQIIADIAQRRGFSYKSTPTTRVFDQVIQAGMTDWEIMVKLAKQHGYSLKCDDTTIYFQPLTQDFTDLRAQASYYYLNGLETKKTTLYSFDPVLGDAIPYAEGQKSAIAISGTDRSTGLVHSNTNQTNLPNTRIKVTAPVFDRYHTDVVAPTWEIAKQESDAANEMARYSHRGTAVIQGNPNLLPDHPIYLDNVGKTYSGFWTILRVEHHIIKEVYTTTLEVGTDSLGLSAKWTDNKDIALPSNSAKRVITQGIRQLNIKPVTVLKKYGNSFLHGASVSASFVENVSKATVNVLPSYRWFGVSGDVQAPPVLDKKMHPLAFNMKLGATNGR